MNKPFNKSLAVIFVSALILFTNLAGLLMSKLVFESSTDADSMPQIFDMVCGFIILISGVRLIYGISMRRKKH